MPKYVFNELQEKEVVPGFHGRFVHGEKMTLTHWRIEEGALLPEHTHPHEQISLLLEGELIIRLPDEEVTLLPGKVLVIPGGLAHSGQAVSDCIVVDIFSPPREEYR